MYKICDIYIYYNVYREKYQIQLNREKNVGFGIHRNTWLHCQLNSDYNYPELLFQENIVINFFKKNLNPAQNRENADIEYKGGLIPQRFQV